MAKHKKQQYSGVVYSTNKDFDYQEEHQNEKVSTLAQNQQQLRVLLDKKQRGGKKVTVVTGFVGNEEHLASLGKLLKQKCGVGGAIKNGEILIQGDFRARIMEILSSEGYKAKLSGG